MTKFFFFFKESEFANVVDLLASHVDNPCHLWGLPFLVLISYSYLDLMIYNDMLAAALELLAAGILVISW